MADIDRMALLDTARSVAWACGQAVRLRQAQAYAVQDKGVRDVVTAVDWESQRLAVEMIRERFPSHGFLAEEHDAGLPATGPVIWVIDPLDGTANYSRRLPVYAVSVAAVVEGRVEAGVIYDVERDETFSARRGGGSQLNGQALHVSARATLGRSLIGVGWGRSDADREQSLAVITRLAYQAQSLRALGSHALSLAWLAAGRLDAFFALRAGAWDVAAGALLVQEAGGQVSSLRGQPWAWDAPETWRLASNGWLHDALVAVVGANAQER